MSELGTTTSVPPAPPPLSPLQTEFCDPHGDTCLIVPLLIAEAKQQKIFVVSSKVMSLVCDAWDKMLGPTGHFREAQITNKEIPLPDDNAAALSILLNIAHLKFDKVPEKLSFQDLLSLAILTDKYGATKLVRPWIKSWIASVQHQVLEPMYEEWLWIAWEFGQLELFQLLAGHLVRRVRMNERGQCVTGKGRILDPLSNDCYFPPEIIENIMKVRQKVIREMLNSCYSKVDRFLSLRCTGFNIAVCNRLDPLFGNQKNCSQRCDSQTFGSLLLSLQRTGLGINKIDASKVNWSIQELSQKLMNLEILAYHDVGQLGNLQGCLNASLGDEIKSTVQHILDSVPCPVLDIHRRHLSRQVEVLYSN